MSLIERFGLVVAALALLLASASAAGQQTPAPVCGPAAERLWLVAPDGAPPLITADTTRADLAAQFGDASLEDARIELDEVAPANQPLGTIVCPDDPHRRLEIIWQDEAARARPASARLRGSGEVSSDWAVAPGITLGTPLAEIQRLNGTAVRLVGFNWDYGGMIVDWRHGALEFLKTGHPQVFIRVEPSDLSVERHAAVAAHVRGASEFRSDLAAMQTLAPRVVRLDVLYLPHPSLSRRRQASTPRLARAFSLEHYPRVAWRRSTTWRW